MSDRMRLLVLDGPGQGEWFPLGEGDQLAGREPSCPVYLASARVSRRHAVFQVAAGRCVVRDMGSANGLRVNGHKMDACELVDGTQVQIGDVLLLFQVQDAPPEGAPARPPVPLDEEPAPTHEVPGLGAAVGGFGAPEPTLRGLEETPAAPTVPQGPISPPPPEAAPPKLWDTVQRTLPYGLRIGLLLLLGGLVLLCGPGGGIFALGRAADSSVAKAELQRAMTLTEAMGHRNAGALARNSLEYELVYFTDEPGVETAWLLDATGSVVAPADRASRSLSDDPLFTQVRRERIGASQPDGDLTRVLMPVKAPATAGGAVGVVGYAYMEIDPSAGSVAGNPSARVVFSLVLLLVVGAGLGAGVWWVSSAPIRSLQDDAELALRGHHVDLSSPSKWGPLEALTQTLTRAIARSGGDPTGPAVLDACPVPLIVCSPTGDLLGASPWGAHLLGEHTQLGRAQPEVWDRVSAMTTSLRPDQPVANDTLVFQGQERQLHVHGSFGPGGLEFLVVVIQ